jgi:hypothetical protein
MKMFVFEEVLWDYTSGMAVIAAESLEQAQQLAYEEFNYNCNWRKETFEEWLKSSNFHRCEGEYEVVGVEAGIKHYVYGGG